MQIYRGIESYPANIPRAIALGVFDGLHLGHRKVLSTLLNIARDRKASATVITFDSHPKSVVKGRAPRCITSTRHKLMLLDEIGIEDCVLLRFDESLARMSARNFAEKAFRGAVGAVMGFDQRFGKDRLGDEKLLRQIGNELGFDVTIVGPVSVRGVPVSSTAVRGAVINGDLELAREMLGRRPSVLGRVVPGTSRGRRLGFPTANLDLEGEIYPPDGVYLTETLLEGEKYPSVTNIGRPNAPVHSDKEPGDSIVESHLLGFSGNLYGSELEVIFLEKLREEKKCRSDEELAGLIASDIARARGLFFREL